MKRSWNSCALSARPRTNPDAGGWERPARIPHKGDGMSRDILAAGQVRVHTTGATREQAMREAADILEAAGAVTSSYFAAMQQRKAAVSTYMGNELAIPHG